MAAQIRVRLDPLSSPVASEGQVLFDGARIALELRGPFSSSLGLDEPVPATLRFEARYLENVRSGSEAEVVALAKLEGTLARTSSAVELEFEGQQGEGGAPTGLVPEEVIDEDAPPSVNDVGDANDREELRVLRFEFPPEQFVNVSAEDEPQELLVRMKPQRFRYCEITVRLELNGATEAPPEQNDVLDVLITPQNPGRRTNVTLRLTDIDGEPLPSARCEIISGARPRDEAADPKALVADGDGFVHLKTVVGASSIEVEWRAADSDTPVFRRTLQIELIEDSALGDERRLNNLGYTEEYLRSNVLAFQSDFEREPTGRLDDIRDDLRAWHDDGVVPAPGGTT